jgi:hypothetical protein
MYGQAPVRQQRWHVYKMRVSRDGGVLSLSGTAVCSLTLDRDLAPTLISGRGLLGLVQAMPPLARAVAPTSNRADPSGIRDPCAVTHRTSRGKDVRAVESAGMQGLKVHRHGTGAKGGLKIRLSANRAAARLPKSRRL